MATLKLGKGIIYRVGADGFQHKVCDVSDVEITLKDPPPELCHCGRPLHYSDPAIEREVRSVIAIAGDEYINVTVDGRTWRVQRHYIALHGLKAANLPQLGFASTED